MKHMQKYTQNIGVMVFMTVFLLLPLLLLVLSVEFDTNRTRIQNMSSFGTIDNNDNDSSQENSLLDNIELDDLA